MAPSRNASGHDRPGIRKYAVTATRAVVKNTSPTAAKVIGRIDDLKLCQLVFHAAAYNKGGRNMIKTMAGSREIRGKPGIRLMRRPETTKTMGKGK
jgi:hypothetical protein